MRMCRQNGRWRDDKQIPTSLNIASYGSDASQPLPGPDRGQRRCGLGEQTGDDSCGVGEAPRVQHSRLGWPADDDCGRGFVGADGHLILASATRVAELLDGLDG